MTDHTPTPAVKVGDTVHYTGQDGRQHQATVDAVHGEHLSLAVMIDGNQQQMTAVPHSAQPAPHTWKTQVNPTTHQSHPQK